MLAIGRREPSAPGLWFLLVQEILSVINIIFPLVSVFSSLIYDGNVMIFVKKKKNAVKKSIN